MSIFIWAGIKIQKGLTRLQTANRYSADCKDEIGRQKKVRRALIDMWLIVGTVTFVVIYQLVINISYTAWANQECYFTNMSPKGQGWFTQFFSRSINYVWWLFVVVYTFWPVEFKETYLSCWFKRVDEDLIDSLLAVGTSEIKPMEVNTIDFSSIHEQPQPRKKSIKTSDETPSDWNNTGLVVKTNQSNAWLTTSDNTNSKAHVSDNS